MIQVLDRKIVLFDFDGVIVDSFELSYQTAKEVGSPLTREQQRKLFEGNLFKALEKVKNLSADHEQQDLDHKSILPKNRPLIHLGRFFWSILASSRKPEPSIPKVRDTSKGN